MFLFSPNQLRQTSREFQRLFPGEVSYAVKANPEAQILRVLWESGIRSYDVASIGEIELVRAVLPSSHLHYNNPVKTPEMVAEAVNRFGVESLVIDDRHGLEILKPYLRPGMEITVRFKLEHSSAAYDFGSKFGADEVQAVELLKAVSDCGARPSLTFHPGSQCVDPHVYGKYIEVAANISRQAGIQLFRLNVGGGFPVSYAGLSLPSLTQYFEIIDEKVRRSFGERRPALLCEPGRAMVASCCSLLTRVVHIRDNGDTFINDGVYGGMQEQVIMECRLPVRAWRHGQRIESETTSRRVFGPTCDPVDKLSATLELPVDLVPGDHLEFGLTGAYGSATATRFNGFEPASYARVRHGYMHSE